MELTGLGHHRGRADLHLMGPGRIPFLRPMPQLAPLQAGDEQRMPAGVADLLTRPDAERGDPGDRSIEVDKGHGFGGSAPLGTRDAARFLAAVPLPTGLLHRGMLLPIP